MNSNWRNRPTTIDYVSSDIKYIICIDESGTSNLKRVIDAKGDSNIALSENDKHFTVTACVLSTDKFEQSRDMVMAVKTKFWDNGLYNYGGVEKRVCLHSREIRYRKNAFNPNIIDYDSFIDSLNELMENLPFELYAAHIDKEKHVNKYYSQKSPYDLCMTFVLERIMLDIGSSNCIVILESRGKKEDREVLKHIKKLIYYGNRYYGPYLFKKIKGVYFNPKWCEAENDKKSYWELEIADLCSHPIHRYFINGHENRAFELIKKRIKFYPNYVGKGLKEFP